MSKVALVTGAGQGIGEAIAIKLASIGTSVIVCDLDLDTVEGIAVEIQGTGVQFDVTEVDRIDELLERVGPVDQLVNCAGVCRTEGVGDITPDGWRHTFAVNVEGAFFLARACAESMKERGGGSIVNIASISGFLPKLEQVAYGASKAAMVSFTRSLAAIYGPDGVRVNAVAPGVIETPLTRSIAEQRGAIRGVDPSSTLEPVIGATPLRRIGQASEVADAVAYLLSDEASFITGQTLDVCGGQLMR